MNTDSLYVIGTGHTVCQDYARAHVSGDLAYAIVSDGCSSSPDTDIGARILTLTAETLLKNKEWFELEKQDFFLAQLAWSRLKAFHNSLLYTTLDATLLSAVLRKDKIYINAHGDGIVMLRQCNGTVEAHEIIYMDGYPGYPSYHLNANRKKVYLANCPGWTCEIHRLPLTSTPITTTLREPLTPFQMTLDAEDYDLVAVMSDGFGSFTRRGESGTEEVPTSEVLEELFKFKFFKGAFVQRRLRRFLKDAAKRGWVHDDDLSVAAVYLGNG